MDLYKHNTTSSRVLHHFDFYKYNSYTLGTLCTSSVFIQIQYQHSRSTSSPGFIRRRPAIMFPSRVNKSLSPATRQRMQCLRFSTIIIRVMTTVKTIFFRALYRFLSFVGEIFVNILFYITSILIVEFLFFDTHGNHILHYINRNMFSWFLHRG